MYRKGAKEKRIEGAGEVWLKNRHREVRREFYEKVTYKHGRIRTQHEKCRNLSMRVVSLGCLQPFRRILRRIWTRLFWKKEEIRCGSYEYNTPSSPARADLSTVMGRAPHWVTTCKFNWMIVPKMYADHYLYCLLKSRGAFFASLSCCVFYRRESDEINVHIPRDPTIDPVLRGSTAPNLGSTTARPIHSEFTSWYMITLLINDNWY